MARHTLPLLLLVASVAVGALACSDTRTPTGQPVPPPPTPFAIRPALDTVVVGDWVRFVAESGSSVDQWISSDTSKARLLGHERDWAAVRIRAPGTVTIKATQGADTGQATLVIRPQDTPPAPVTIGNWEAISLGLMDHATGSALAISEDGTIVGVLRDYLATQYGYGQGLAYGFIYRDGVMQELWSSDTLYHDYVPSAIGASRKIIGTTGYRGRLMVWDSADAAPRFLGDEPVSGIFGPNADGDFLVNSTGSEYGSASKAVLWRRDGTRVDLGYLNGTAGQKSTWATAWNDAEQIVGSSIVGYGLEVHPFLWENGVMRDLGELGIDNGAYVTDINAHGVMVGTRAADTLSRAFIWQDGVMRDLGAFPGQETHATAINDQGRVLGVAGYPYKASQYDYYGPGDTVFVWDNGQAQIVTTTRAMGLWLRPNGTVVLNTDVYHEPRALVWEAGVLTDFGPYTSVSDVNSHGDMVGRRGDMPMLWRRKGSE